MRSYAGRVLDVQRGATSNGHLPAGVATGAADTLLLVMRPTEAAADAMAPVAMLLWCPLPAGGCRNPVPPSDIGLAPEVSSLFLRTWPSLALPGRPMERIAVKQLAPYFKASVSGFFSGEQLPDERAPSAWYICACLWLSVLRVLC